jgi:AcrR family transcriptional regulator
MASPGRPRSESAREAVIHAVDDLLVEQGYAAMTMKSIAERAGVGRQTLYRWWANKAEVLFEAAVVDSGVTLTLRSGGTARARLTAYLESVAEFLLDNPAGAGWRALIGEAQHDPAVAALIRTQDPLAAPTLAALDELGVLAGRSEPPAVVVQLVLGPVLAAVLVADRATALAAARATAAAVLDAD